MTGDAIPPKQPIDKAYSIASIKACIPSPLDLDKLNYDSWSNLFKRFCRTYDVVHHLDKPADASTSNTDPHHATNDSLVVMWMYSTISPKLVDMVIDDTTLAHEVWARLKSFFHDNKAARIIQLDNEIRSMVIGNMSVTDYFQEVKSKADRLANLDSKVSDSSLVTYTINGLRARFPELVRIIRHKEPLPTFEQVRTMIVLEESDMAQLTHALSSAHLNSSSPTVLVATTPSNTKSGNMQNSGGELCRNFQRGSCTYGSRCKFIHGDQAARSRSTNSGTSSPSKPQGSSTVRASQQPNREQSSKVEATVQAPVVPHSFSGMSGMQFVNPYLFTQPGIYPMQQKSNLFQPKLPYSVMGHGLPQQAHLATQVPQQAHTPVQPHLGTQAQYPVQSGTMFYPGQYAYTIPSAPPPQATMLPQAFQTMTLPDPAWNMDTGASSHLADNTGLPDGQTSSPL